jgi:hypothetical protein
LASGTIGIPGDGSINSIDPQNASNQSYIIYYPF